MADEPLTDEELDDIELVLRTHEELKKLGAPGISQRDNTTVLRLVAEVRRLRGLRGRFVAVNGQDARDVFFYVTEELLRDVSADTLRALLLSALDRARE